MLRCLSLACFCLCLLGCPKPKPTGPPATIGLAEADRPPLRIRVTASGELVEAIARRWKSISDQRLEMEPIAPDVLLSDVTLKADILIAESRWLPTFVERGWIATLPKQIAEATTDLTPSDSQRTQWPLVWRQSATYGRRLWGIPLGVPMMALVESAPSRSSSRLSWVERVTNHESTTQNQETVPDTFLLDRFLIIAASMNPSPTDSGFLFNLNNMRSRLNEAWLIEAAALFGKLYRDRFELATASPDRAWELVAAKASDWALAWPAMRYESSLSVHPTSPWLDSGLGLVASLTNANRQSATSIRFLNWLDEDAQRQEFAMHSSAIQPLPDRWTSASEQIDVNHYRELMKQAFDDRFVAHELRFAESRPYRQSLVEALGRVLQNPASAEKELRQCSDDWDQLTAKIGRDIQKRRLAMSLNLEAYRDER